MRSLKLWIYRYGAQVCLTRGVNMKIDRSFITVTLLGIGLILTLIATFFVPTPIREGNVVTKGFTPAHYVFTGKVIVYVNDNWHVTISKCTETDNCSTANYNVSEATYENTRIGDSLKFTVEDNLWRWIIRAVVFSLGIMCLWLAYMCFDFLIDDHSIWMMILGVIMILVCCIIGYVSIFLGIKGPEGFI